MLDAFRAHLDDTWPDNRHDEVASARAQIEELLPGFRVRRIAPAAGGQPWIYATGGASLPALAEDGEGAEYVVLAPSEDRILPEMLAALATVNARPQSRVGVGSVIALGRPWLAGSDADHMLVLPPYFAGAGFEICSAGDARIVVLWLVPITASEARFVRRQGYEAFEQLIERHEANVADPARAPLA